MTTQLEEDRNRLQAHHLRNVVLGASAIAIALSLLWITAARGYIELPNWVLPVVRARPYGPDQPVYGGWMWATAVVAAASVLVALATYVIYRISKQAGGTNEEE